MRTVIALAGLTSAAVLFRHLVHRIACLGLGRIWGTAHAWYSDLLNDLLAPDARRHHIAYAVLHPAHLAYAVWVWATIRARSSR